MKTYEKGITLIEIMIVAAVLAIVITIAVPILMDSGDTATQGVMNNNIETIRLFQEDHRLAERSYVAGVYRPTGTTDFSLRDRLGWEPRVQNDTITYTVTCGTAIPSTNFCTVADGYTVTATDGTITVTRTF
ncbi:MAG: prepilin-type N-terminal cleavage/methylation domain-containing protein [Pseudomonadota bacterium]